MYHPKAAPRWKWAVLLFWAAVLLLAGLPRTVWADFSCQGLTWPDDYPYTWTYNSSAGSYSKYIRIRGHDDQGSGVNPNGCWGGGVTSWGVSFGVENYTNRPAASGGAGQPSDISITAYRVKFYTSGGQLVHTENIAPGELNDWFDQNGSNYPSTMASLGPGKRGVG